ncbi:YwqJ-related putative deaminase, partial [Streptomyces sp. NPDC001634]|uniref:YwqJ-related putative deaminase n=1 Tax=Streptomyces sp. NPDC001634 TaxID=3154390 RepID=UPI003318BDD9
EGAVKLPDGNVQLPHHEGPVLPEGTTKLPTEEGAAARYYDPQGNLLDEHGNVLQKAQDAPKGPDGNDVNPPAGSDVPHTPSPVKEPALVGAATPTVEHAGQSVRLGSSVGHDLGDVGRAPDNAAVHAGGDNLPTVHAGGDGLLGGHAGDHLPGGSAHEHGSGPAASHGDGPSGAHEPMPPHRHDPVQNEHADNPAHHGGRDGHGTHTDQHGDGSASPGEHVNDTAHHSESGASGPDGPGSSGLDDFGHQPEGASLDPQPDWHGQSAGQMKHYRRPALDVSHLPIEHQLAVLDKEAAKLADEARDAPAGVAPSGQNHLTTGCAGSFLHDNVITAHTSTTKMHGQKLPHTHQVLQGILKQISDDVDAGVLPGKGTGHGKCAEISLISDRLHQLDPSGTQIRTAADARRLLEGSVMHTRKIGDFIRRDGEVVGRHNDYLPPCDTCKHILPALGIRAH